MFQSILQKLLKINTFAVTCILLIFLALCFFTHPAADDFAVAAGARSGIFNNIIRLYVNWFGRYSASFFCSLQLFYLDHYFIYQVVSFVQLLSFLFSLYYCLAFYFEPQKAFFFTSGLFITFVCCQNNLAEVFYWQSGSFVYLLPLIFSLVLLRLEYQKNKLWLSLLLIILIVGHNEVIMLVLLSFFGYRIIFDHLLIYRKITPDLYIKTLLTVICIAIVVFAPGNEIRTKVYTNNTGVQIHNLNFSLNQSLHSIQVSIFRVFQKGTFFLFLALTFFNLKFAPQKVRISILKMAYFFIVLFLLYFVFYWSVGTEMEPRTESTIYFYQILFLSYSASILFSLFIKHLNNQYVYVAFHLLLFVSLTQQYNLRYTVRDITYKKAYNYHQLFLERYQVLRLNDSKDTLTLAKFPRENLPFSIHSTRTNFPDSLSRASGSWTRWFGDKFHIDKIIIE